MKDTLQLFIEQPQVFDEVKILSESKDPDTGKWSVTFNSILQDVSKPTNNRRFYPKPLMEQKVQYLNSTFIAKNHLYGEYDHPLSDIMKATSDEMALKRQISVLLEKVSHQFLRLWMDGNYIMGTVKTLHTFYGRQMTDLIVLDKATVGFSLRSAGIAKPSPEGYQVIQPQGFTIVTWDAVINPASPQALFKPNSESFAFSESAYDTDLSTSRCVNGVCDIIKEHPEMLNETNEHVKDQLLRNKVELIFKNLKF